MAITTPNPGDILKDSEVELPKTGFVTGRGVTPEMVQSAERVRQNYVPVTRKIANTLEDRQARSFARLAEDTLIEADRKYKENPTTENKAAWDVAYSDFVKATNQYKEITKTTYQTNRVKQEIVGDLPAEPKGFDPYKDKPTGGAQTPGDRAKIDGAPDYIPPNPLDNNRWNNALIPIPGTYDHYWDKDPTMSVPVSFFPNSAGAIYQREDALGSPETRDAAVDRIMSEYANAGKMNELRELFIRSKIAASPSDIAAMSQANQIPNSGYAKDPGTRTLIERAVQLGTLWNVTAARANQKAVTFAEFLNAYDGSLNGSGDGNGYGGGSGLPRRTVDINKRVFTPEELELNLDAFFQEYTGQGASKEDVDYFVKRLNAQPAQKTVTTRSGNKSTSIQTGGVDQMEQQYMMREMALKDPEAESYNKATTYLNYFREALASPIELG